MAIIYVDLLDFLKSIALSCRAAPAWAPLPRHGWPGRGLLLAWVSLLAFVTNPAPAADLGAARQRPEAPHNGRYRTDRILIKPRPQGRASLAAMHSRHGSRVLKKFQSLGDLELVRLPQGSSVEAAIAEYQRSGLVEFAEPDYLVHTMSLPNDPKYVDGTLWAFQNSGQSGGLAGADISAVPGWGVLNSASNIVVAIIDTGIRYTHEDLAENMWVNPKEIPGNGIDDDSNGYVDDIHGVNALGNNGDPFDEVGHGTHVAGIVGAVGNNGKGVVGVAWRVKLMACKFMDDTGFGAHSDAVQAIDYARTHGAHVINASWGGASSSLSLRSAVSRARTAGIIFVAASGNESQNDDIVGNYPSGYDFDNVISVASTTRSDQLANFSNFGATTVDLAAPGTAIYSTWHSSDRSYTFNSGTSMSAPFVSGAMALLRAKFPNDTPKQLIDRVLAATDPLPSLAGKCASGGRLNLHRALSASLLADFSASRLSGIPPLTVLFQDTSVGKVARREWDFGDGTRSTEAAPTHVFNAEGDYTVTLTVTDAQGATSYKSRTVTVLANYRIVSTNFNWIDPANMRSISLTDNGVSSAQTLPFPFVFYGQIREQIYIGANGLIGFSNQGLTTTSNTDLPAAAAPNAMICPYWDNLNPAAGGTVRFGVVGQSPHRRAVISWVEVPRNSTPTAQMTFQAILEEGSNQIVFQYLEVQPNSSRGGGRGATVGVENEFGNVAAKYTFNGSPSLLRNKQALVFVPSTPAGIVISPLAAAPITGKVGGPFSPDSQSFTIENRSGRPLRWSAYNIREWLTLSAETGTLAPGEETQVTARLTSAANALAAGSYVSTILFTNEDTGIGSSTRTITLVIDGAAGVLTVAPDSGLVSSGSEGGPFSPVSQVFTLLNTGDARIDWKASVTKEWITVSPSEGSLAAGASATVSVLLNENTVNLPAGPHADEISFVNQTNGNGSSARSVKLDVRAGRATRLASPETTPEGGFRFRLSAEPGKAFVIEASLDLLRWVPISTNVVDADGTFEFIESSTSETQNRFYRAVAK